MALIKCNECGKEISDKADVCINCGNPIQKSIKYAKPFNELSKKEKKLVGSQAIKDTTYIIFNITIIIFVIFFIILFPSLLSLFVNMILIIIQVIVNNILVKKYYNENLFYANKDIKKNKKGV